MVILEEGGPLFLYFFLRNSMRKKNFLKSCAGTPICVDTFISGRVRPFFSNFNVEFVEEKIKLELLGFGQNT
jgi:hypothetical protein